MKTNTILWAIGIILILSACKKSSEPDITPLPDFMNLKVGNYWVYEYYKIDSNGFETKLPKTDTSFIEKDTTINDITYYKWFRASVELKGQKYPTFVRDSLGYLVTDWGAILFSRDNFTDTLVFDTLPILTSILKMVGKDSIVQVSAGSFTTRTARLTVFPTDPHYPWGVRYFYNVYGANTGLILWSYALYSQPSYYEARLSSFHNAH